MGETSRRSVSRIHSPHSSSFLAWQEGKNPRVRHENITNRSSPQSGQRIRANPQRGLPQSRYRSTISLTIEESRLVFHGGIPGAADDAEEPERENYQPDRGLFHSRLRTCRCWRRADSSSNFGRCIMYTWWHHSTYFYACNPRGLGRRWFWDRRRHHDKAGIKIDFVFRKRATGNNVFTIHLEYSAAAKKWPHPNHICENHFRYTAGDSLA